MNSLRNDAVDLDYVMTELGAGTLDEVYAVLAELFQAFGIDVLRYGVESLIFHSHEIIDLFKISLDGGPQNA